MKKILALVCIAALSLVLLIGCGGNGGTGNGTDNGNGTNNGNGANNGGNGGTATLSGNIDISGSTSVQNVIEALMEAFEEIHSGVTITFNPTGTGAGITAAQNNTTDIGMASRELRATETGVTSTTFAIDGLAVIVHPSNPVTDLTLEQIADIFNGEITNWSEVGGNDAPIALIARNAGSGSRDAFEDIVGVDDDAEFHDETGSGGAMITAVSGNPNAIGYASLAGVADSVRALQVNGVAISEATLQNGTFPVARNFNIIMNSTETPAPHVQAFIDFIRGPQATEIISRAGVLQAAR